MVFCTYCGQSFTRDEHLHRHMRTHFNVKPFKCFVCHSSFTRRDLLEQHHTVHGKDHNQETILAANGMLPRSADRTPISCSNCAKTKTKCDKKFPCSRCAGRNLKCTLRPTRPAIERSSELPSMQPYVEHNFQATSDKQRGPQYQTTHRPIPRDTGNMALQAPQPRVDVPIITDGVCGNVSVDNRFDDDVKKRRGSGETQNVQAIQASSARSIPLELEVRCLLNGRETSCFPDTGAGANYMSLPYAQRNELQINTGITDTVKLPNGKSRSTLGTVSVPFSFESEAEIHQIIFNVIPSCIRDVIIGSPFLHMMETFTRFAHRITKRLRSHLSCPVRYIGAPQQRLQGRLGGYLVQALPDSGSDLSLISMEYAKRCEFRIDTSGPQQKLLEFADGSLEVTKGLVQGLTWRYGNDESNVFPIDCYVLDELDCDILLGYPFLEDTEAFVHYQAAFVNLGNNDIIGCGSNLNIITFRANVVQELKAKFKFRAETNTETPAHQTWEQEKRKLLTRKEKLEQTPTGEGHAPENQCSAYLRWEAAWATHMSKEPIPADQANKGSCDDTSR